MANLTLQNHLVRNLGTPKSEPGHHLVVYRETSQGLVYYKTVPRGEVFRPPLLDRWFGSFIGYAVPAGEDRRHRFSVQLETGVGDRHDMFTLHVTVGYWVADPALLVERLSDDPLGSLESEIRSALKRRAANLRYEQLMDEGFDIEGYVLGVDGREQQQKDTDNLERFQSLAAEFGMQLERVEIIRTHSAEKIGRGVEAAQAGYEAVAKIGEVQATHEVETVRLRSEIELQKLKAEEARIKTQTARQVDILNSLSDGLQRVVANIATNTGTISELNTVIKELTRARTEIGRMIAPQALPLEPPAGGALVVANTQDPLAQELHRMLEILEDLRCRPTDRDGLAGRILHILAELCLGEDSDDGRLEGYVAELGRYCKAIELVQAISREEQRHYFGRLRDLESVRRTFGGLSVYRDAEKEGTP